MTGGLPDHTDRLADALSSHFDVTVLTSVGADTARPFAVRAMVSDWRDAAAVLRAVEGFRGVILWQYVPHMYGRGGVNLALPRVMRSLARQGRRQVAIVHEIAAPFSLWPHRAAYALAHRVMWSAVWRHADALGISTAGWLQRLRLRPDHRDRLFLAPSPSNVPVVPCPADHAASWRNAAGIAGAKRVLGFFGSTGAGKGFPLVLGCWRAARRLEPSTALVVIGDRPAPPRGVNSGFLALGHVDAAEASRALQAIDLMVLPFADGVSERRSSFMAGLAHGRAILTTLGPATGAELRDANFFAGAPGRAESLEALTTRLLADEARLLQLGEAARRAYATRYDWPRLAAILAGRIAAIL